MPIETETKTRWVLVKSTSLKPKDKILLGKKIFHILDESRDRDDKYTHYRRTIVEVENHVLSSPQWESVLGSSPDSDSSV